MRAWVLVLALALGGCDGDGTGLDQDPAGTYDLITVGGASLPRRTGDVELVSSVIVLRPDRTYSITINDRLYGAAGQPPITRTNESTGTYTVTETAVRMRSTQTGATVEADYDGTGELVLEEGGSVALYRRR